MRINDAVSLLVSVFMDWEGTLLNPRFVRNGNTIEWMNNQRLMLEYPVRGNDVARLAESGQYTFQIAEDGALIQLRYSYHDDGERLLSANLAYYGGPTSVPDEWEEEDNDGEAAGDSSAAPASAEEVSSEFVPWMRIDYQPIDARGVLHGECHLHTSGFPDSRFLVRGVPTPKQFIEFIMVLCYPEIYRERRLTSEGKYADTEHMKKVNSPVIDCDTNEAFKLMTHILIPRG